MKKSRYVIFRFVLFLVIDLGTKYFFVTKGVGGFSSLLNTGAAWGLPANPYLLATVGILWSIAMMYMYHKKYISMCVLVLLLAGAIGNIIDRLYLGGVRDRIDLGFFPVFNIADVYITLGAIFLLYKEFYRPSGCQCEKK